MIELLEKLTEDLFKPYTKEEWYENLSPEELGIMLCSTVKFRDIDDVKRLLEAGADVNAKGAKTAEEIDSEQKHEQTS